ncbi:MAG: hypothetical protein O3A84_11530 [Proteobacteria bacterium]|nr:hypothetical protein [Pseudomonadota bacterium]
MPDLPSGLNLAISRQALFDHGGNWFKCPDGSFWYWVPDPEIGPPPFDPDDEILLIAEHAPVPETREEAKRFIRVLEMTDDGKYGWRGEILSLFPRYTELDTRDLEAWNAWINRTETENFLDDTIAECQRLAVISQHARGYAMVEGTGEPEQEGWIKGNLRTPTKGS